MNGTRITEGPKRAVPGFRPKIFDIVGDEKLETDGNG